MNNWYLSESLKSKELTTDSRKIISEGWTLLGKAMDSITSVPIFDMVSSISDGIIAIREYRILKMIAHFFENFDSLNWEERMEFSYRLQTEEEYEDFTEKILFYLESLQDKQKAIWIGKMAIGLARNKISMHQFELSVFAIQNSMPGDLILLKNVFYQAINERKNELVTERNTDWLETYVFQYIGLHYYNSDGLQNLKKRTINSFLSIGLMEREMKEFKKSARDLGLDGGVSVLEGYREIYSFSEISFLIFMCALKD
ncbi:hypothetical protein DFQ04_0045 [Algoriphagus boseongensis]|uniref:Uncharacterized protein n=1 Tax=Algoriphagus boseongensis TaxID=1442587 RepID=A0A4V3D2B1_9BACT|nr:hypothetical protein [Algoriphagus boseongensis]TDQ18247.1 hypothetical protein DFQ04_0045 [Algoriphagus boseongensis]